MDPNVLRLAMGAAGAGGDEFQLFSWGFNGSGQLGQNNPTNYSSPRQVGSLKDWSVISGGKVLLLLLKPMEHFGLGEEMVLVNLEMELQLKEVPSTNWIIN